MKVETHNHPTAIAPFPGAATGAGGEIRDEGATGQRRQAEGGPRRLHGVAPAHSARCRSRGRSTTASRTASRRRLTIMHDGPIGAAAFNNEFGRPNLAGYFRTFEQRGGGRDARLSQADHDRRRRRQHRAPRTRTKRPLPDGTLLIQLGGPGMLIGMGGGAASSMATGVNTADLDFDSVQRGNAEMERRAQEVIDRCWQLGDRQPDPVDSRRRRGRAVERAARARARRRARRARSILRAIPSEEPGMTPREIWCNEAQERYVLAIAPADLERFRAICERERCPFAVVGRATADAAARRRRSRISATRRSTCRSTCCSASRRR